MKMKFIIINLLLSLFSSSFLHAQNLCNYVSLNQVSIEDNSDTTISGYFRINDYMLTSNGAVKFDIKAQFNPVSNFKYIKLFSDSLCNSALITLDMLISDVEPYKVDGSFEYNFNVCDTTLRVFLKFKLFDFTEYVYGMDVVLKSTIGINSKSEKNRMKLYPNPVTNTLNIKGIDRIDKTLYNSMGEFIIETNKNLIDFRAYPKGLYFLKINNLIYKIIKQ